MFIFRHDSLNAVKNEKGTEYSNADESVEDIIDYKPGDTTDNEIEFLPLRKRGRQSQKLQKFLQLHKHRLTKQESMAELMQLRAENKVLFVAYLKGGELEPEELQALAEKVELPIDTTYQSTGAIENSMENHLKTAVKVTSTYLVHPRLGEPLRINFRGRRIEIRATAVDY